MAARELSTKYNLNVNLYLVSSLIHAMACAEAGAAAVSIPIGQVGDLVGGITGPESRNADKKIIREIVA